MDFFGHHLNEFLIHTCSSLGIEERQVEHDNVLRGFHFVAGKRFGDGLIRLAAELASVALLLYCASYINNWYL
jgi:hypothetical protein